MTRHPTSSTDGQGRWSRTTADKGLSDESALRISEGRWIQHANSADRRFPGARPPVFYDFVNHLQQEKGGIVNEALGRLRAVMSNPPCWIRHIDSAVVPVRAS